MNKIANTMAISVFAAGLGVACFAGMASARTIAPIAGRVLNANDASCLASFNGMLTNVCSRLVSVEIPLSVDNNGPKNVAVVVFSATGNNTVSCIPFAADQTGTPVSTGSWDSVQGFQHNTWARLTFVNDPSKVLSLGAWQTLSVLCHVSPGGKVSLVTYNQ